MGSSYQLLFSLPLLCCWACLLSFNPILYSYGISQNHNDSRESDSQHSASTCKSCGGKAPATVLFHKVDAEVGRPIQLVAPLPSWVKGSKMEKAVPVRQSYIFPFLFSSSSFSLPWLQRLMGGEKKPQPLTLPVEYDLASDSLREVNNPPRGKPTSNQQAQPRSLIVELPQATPSASDTNDHSVVYYILVRWHQSTSGNAEMYVTAAARNNNSLAIIRDTVLELAGYWNPSKGRFGTTRRSWYWSWDWGFPTRFAYSPHAFHFRQHDKGEWECHCPDCISQHEIDLSSLESDAKRIEARQLLYETVDRPATLTVAIHDIYRKLIVTYRCGPGCAPRHFLMEFEGNHNDHQHRLPSFNVRPISDVEQPRNAERVTLEQHQVATLIVAMWIGFHGQDRFITGLRLTRRKQPRSEAGEDWDLNWGLFTTEPMADNEWILGGPSLFPAECLALDQEVVNWIQRNSGTMAPTYFHQLDATVGSCVKLVVQQSAGGIGVSVDEPSGAPAFTLALKYQLNNDSIEEVANSSGGDGQERKPETEANAAPTIVKVLQQPLAGEHTYSGSSSSLSHRMLVHYVIIKWRSQSSDDVASSKTGESMVNKPVIRVTVLALARYNGEKLGPTTAAQAVPAAAVAEQEGEHDWRWEWEWGFLARHFDNTFHYYQQRSSIWRELNLGGVEPDEKRKWARKQLHEAVDGHRAKLVLLNDFSKKIGVTYHCGEECVRNFLVQFKVEDDVPGLVIKGSLADIQYEEEDEKMALKQDELVTLIVLMWRTSEHNFTAGLRVARISSARMGYGNNYEDWALEWGYLGREPPSSKEWTFMVLQSMQERLVLEKRIQTRIDKIEKLGIIHF